MLFRGLRRASKVSEERLPAVNAFVDVAVGGRPIRSVSVEAIGGREVVVSDVLGRAGETGVFVYENAHGKFRFSTRVLGVASGKTRFELPSAVTLVGASTGGEQKRNSVRLDVLVTGSWRFAPGGKAVGEYLKGNLRDISRGGCSLITDRLLKQGQNVEVKLGLRGDGEPLVLLGEVMRSSKIPTSGRFSHGVRFVAVTPAEDQVILEFINRRQAELRSRGLA